LRVFVRSRMMKPEGTMTDDTTKPAGPLTGIRVLDAATFLAGPFCATTMAEFGAEVIKIEHPKLGDPLRKLGTPVEGGETLWWLNDARNKKAITLDFAKVEGAELFKKLVKHADVVIENFRPGTMEKWGLGYEQLRAVNPAIVMVRVTAFGQDGPYKDRPGFARIAHAFSGLAHLVGERGGKPLVPGSMGLADYLSGVYALVGTLLALRYRERTGEGQFVDVALYETIFRFFDEMVPVFARFGEVRQAMGAESPTIVPHSHYRCADGSWVAIACSSDKMFERLAIKMGRPELVRDPESSTMLARVRNRERIDAIVSEWTGRHSRDELVKICLAGEIPCGPVNNIADIFADPHFKARNNLRRIEDPDAGEVVVPGVVPRLSLTPGTIEHLGPHKGVDTERVLSEWLGLNPEQIAELRAREVI
jgi:crotonobetainyl-CoA:carnitine CoA-transferase CaiB-like acyl-CoA transferase